MSAPDFICVARLQDLLESVAVEDVVPQDQANLVGPDELPPEEKGLRQSLRTRLHDIRDPQAPLAPVLQQRLEPRTFLRRRDDEDVPDSRQHQHRQGVVDHRLVVDGKESACSPPWWMG